MVAPSDGVLDELLPSGGVEFGPWVRSALGELRAEVGPAWVVAKEWLQLVNGAEL